MTYIGTTDFYAEVAKGNVPGHSLVHKFGRNTGIPNGSYEFVAELGQTDHVLSAATTVRVAAGNVNDDSAGSGARKVIVQGIDSALAEAAEEIITAGTSASVATTALFWRVHRVWVSEVGTYGGNNTGDVTIENSAGTADIVLMQAGDGQSQECIWTVPIGKTAHLVGLIVGVKGTKPADIRVCRRENMNDTVAPMSPRRQMVYLPGVDGTVPFSPKSPGTQLLALTDVWAEARGSGGTSEVSVDMEFLVVDDPTP